MIRLMDDSTLLSKFKGSFLAALAGDCAGAQFEAGWMPVELKTLNDLDAKLKKHEQHDKDERPLYYTDDSEMAHVLAKSFITDEGFSPARVAARFASTYFASTPNRWYGASVGTVFEKLRDDSYANDPFRAATEQFSGQGSFGNGSAMRVFPVALYFHRDDKEIEKVASESARITHSHIDAVNGAILQAMAVETALSSYYPVTWTKFWQELKIIADKLEVTLDDKPYTTKLKNMYKLLSDEKEPTIKRIENDIGMGIKATEAVCAAIFAFLYCLADRQPRELSSFTKVQQAICYAISLGGDTDTIGTMTGAVAGAYYGCGSLPKHWLSACEGEDTAITLANGLFDAASKRIFG